MYKIESKAGEVFGYYPGTTPAEALLARHRDAGYGPDVVWLEEDDLGRQEVRFVDDGKDGTSGDASYREMCGDVDDWIIEEAPEFMSEMRRGWIETVKGAGSASHLETTVVTYNDPAPADADPFAIGASMAREHLATVRR